MITNKDLNEIWQLYGTQYRPPKFLLMDVVNLGDRVQIQKNGLYEGIVTEITIKGLGVYTDDGYKFSKWCNVISVLNK